MLVEKPRTAPPVAEPAPSQPLLHVVALEPSPGRGRAVVRCVGELDIATAADLEQKIRQLTDRGITSIAIDLRQLTFIDCSGLRLLTTLKNQADEHGRTIDVLYSDGPVSRLIELTRLSSRFPRQP
jgi:anti-sigma B factor antagonist